MMSESAKTKVTVTKTKTVTALTGKQETYNLHDLHCGVVELDGGSVSVSSES